MSRAILYGLISVLLLCAVDLTIAGVQHYPPERFEENPNARVITPRDDLNYRLPNDTKPHHYDITLTTNVHQGVKAFTGVVSIDLEIVEKTSEIVVHARQLKDFVASIKSKNVVPAVEHKLNAEYDNVREFLTLKPTVATVSFEKDTNWTLTISYNGELREDNGGFYLSTFTDDKGVVRYLATTQFESTDARHAFPCYDETSKRATFAITIKHDPSYRAISNMPKNEALSSNGVTVFDTTLSMPTYLVAFIVSDFVESDGKLNGLVQRVFSRKETSNDQEWALTSGMILEKRLSQYFDVPFALPKLDQAAIPDFAAGAMENWGLATYREEYLLYNPKNSTVMTQTNVATVVSHEYTHMWFGDLVSIEWWTYTWLKEGFATLFEYLAVDLAYPEWDIFQVFHASSYQSALASDAGPNPRPMTHYVQTPLEIQRVFDYVSYAKAGSVLNMWRNALTNKVFQRGVHNYLEANKFKSADENKLFDAIAIGAKEENYPVERTIHEMFSSWTQRGGYPLLTVKRHYNNGTFTVTQEAFFNDGTNQVQSKLWHVPINYAVQSQPDFRNTEATHYLFRQPAISISDLILNDDWLILNKQSTGYYRINYDTDNWELITKGLIERSHKIHQRNRAQLINDAYIFSTSYRLSHSILLELLKYLPSEDQYAPWASANSVFNTFNRYLSTEQNYYDFQSYLRQLVSSQYDKFGTNDISGEQHLAKYTRNILINLACMAGVPSCLHETHAKLKALVNNNIAIEPNLQAQTYCNGLKKSSDSEFNFVYDKLMLSNDQAERRLLISSLGCAQEENKIKKFIESSIDHTNQLRTQERTTLLRSAYSRGEVGLLTSIAFLDQNFDAYGKLTAGAINPLQSDLVGISSYIVNDNQRENFLALLAKVKDSEHVEATLETTVNANIKANYDWLSRNRQPIMIWLANQRSGSSSLVASFVSVCMALLLIISLK